MSMQKEFQVVLLAGGRGQRLYPLTETHAKPLLAVANRPLLGVQLEFLEEAGFEEVFVVTCEDRGHAEIATFLDETYRGKLKATVVPMEAGMGTAEVIVRMRAWLTTDFIVLPSDLIVPEPRAFLHRLADVHRTKSAAITTLAFKRRSVESSGSDEGQREAGPALFFGIAEPGGRLAMFQSADELDDDGETLAVRKALLRRVPRLAIRGDLDDAHLYIVSHWALDVLPEVLRDRIVSLQLDFVPTLVRGQFRRAWRERAATILDQDRRTLFEKDADDVEDAIKCFVHVLDESHYCRRVNTIEDYMAANRELATRSAPAGYKPTIPLTKNNYVDPDAEIDKKTQVGADCVVGAGTAIGEKCSIKRSNIGEHCKIGAQVKVVNSVVLDHVIIGDGAVVQNCILSSNCQVQAGVNLKDCVLGSRFEAKHDMKSQRLSTKVGTASVGQ